MKIVGLIAEYNPFHNGHKYHIEKSKEITGADEVIVIMSGNFVQRGTPAIMPKEIRVKAALEAGASMVLELPTCYATGSAEHFAKGAIATLDKLQCVDAICFGSEYGDISLLDKIADILVSEPAHYKTLLQKYIKEGNSFPKARQQAFSDYMKSDDSIDSYIIDEIFGEPNNILGIEYLKALKVLGSKMKPYTIKRLGSGYHDISTDSEYCSASALRNDIDHILEYSDLYPKNLIPILRDHYHQTFPVVSDDFSLILKSFLLYETPESLIKYADVSNDLANRIHRLKNDYQSFDQFIDLLKTKEITYTRVSRALLHIVLRLQHEALAQFDSSGIAFYARVLGFRKDSSELFTMLKKHSELPILTKPSAMDSLDENGKQMLEIDVLASNLYQSVITDKYKVPFHNELTWRLIKA